MTPVAQMKMDRRKTFNDFISKKHLKSTKQRDVIFDEFFGNYMGRHITVEELYEDIKRKYPHIGFATVYRTLKLFRESGIASERNFGDGKARIESVYWRVRGMALHELEHLGELERAQRMTGGGA